MSARRPNPRLVKIHRNYSVEEIAALFGVHKNTVRTWIKQGLPLVDTRRPMLVLGSELATYLVSRREKNKRSCEAGEIYCVRCRAPKHPAGNMADFLPSTELLGTLVGICPDCHSLIYRRVNPTRLPKIRGQLDITQPQAQQHIRESG